jgi:hypothetical protein
MLTIGPPTIARLTTSTRVEIGEPECVPAHSGSWILQSPNDREEQMLKQDPISDITVPNERHSTQLSAEKHTTKSITGHFAPVNLVPSLLSRSLDFYREHGWRGS